MIKNILEIVVLIVLLVLFLVLQHPLWLGIVVIIGGACVLIDVGHDFWRARQKQKFPPKE